MSERNRSREAVRHADPADLLRVYLRGIAGAWADLQETIQPGSSGGGDPVTGTVEHGVSVNFGAVQAAREVTAAAWFVARVVTDETSTTPPDPLRDLPTFLRWLATWRAPWLAHHPDLGEDQVDEWRRHAKRVLRIVYAERVRTIRVGVPCPEHLELDPDGERVRCTGTLTVPLDPKANGLVPDMVCDVDDRHRISPEEWFRASRRAGYEPDRVGDVLAERRAVDRPVS